MTAPDSSAIAHQKLMQTRNGLIIHQSICAAAKLGVADLLEQGLSTTAELARELNANEDALYRTLRALASEGVFEETSSRTFKNSGLSCLLRSDVPGSVRPAFLFWGTEMYYRSVGACIPIRSSQTASL